MFTTPDALPAHLDRNANLMLPAGVHEFADFFAERCIALARRIAQSLGSPGGGCSAPASEPTEAAVLESLDEEPADSSYGE